LYPQFYIHNANNTRATILIPARARLVHPSRTVCWHVRKVVTGGGDGDDDEGGSSGDGSGGDGGSGGTAAMAAKAALVKAKKLSASDTMELLRHVRPP
jgi:hypothetical protein